MRLEILFLSVPYEPTRGLCKILANVNHAAREYSRFAIITQCVTIHRVTIKSFKCSETKQLFERQRVKRFRNIESVARRKLEQMEWSESLDDLRVPPGNRLEALRGDRAGQHSIRINDQLRVCFIWTPEGAVDVEIVDYH